MTQRIRLARGSRNQQLPDREITRKHLETACASLGLTLEIKRVNQGEWNEGRQIIIAGRLAEFVMKNEKPSWSWLTDHAFAIARNGG